MSFAQQPNDANAPGAYGTAPPDVNATTGVPNNAEIDRTGTTPSYDGSRRDTTLNHSCSGLADRQTERACREGISTDHANMPNSAGYDRGGPTEDQAD